jgi:hypothetical protein
MQPELAQSIDDALLESLETSSPGLCKTIRQLVAIGEPRQRIASAIQSAAPVYTLTYHAAILFLDKAIREAARPA